MFNVQLSSPEHARLYAYPIGGWCAGSPGRTRGSGTTAAVCGRYVIGFLPRLLRSCSPVSTLSQSINEVLGCH
ncbi:hypothetical protein FOMPIDRAFT_160764 [Fomitopsis schrenkii]|uniref:Uncharacterized protein n=1 Tax=Fomitopsis schrenkii TaxID=2126942 RepID=S8FMX4_FOMSC|nr:hypothetical protein FOMPIDRAFT_160764 [Fomitopsis schrenkii]